MLGYLVISMSAETLSSGAAPQKTEERELRSYLSTSGCRARKSNSVGTTATPRILYRCRRHSQSQTENDRDDKEVGREIWIKRQLRDPTTEEGS